MKTPAIISALTVVGSIAFAAGQSQTVRVMPDEEKPLEGEMPPMMAMGAGSCQPYPEEVWFDTTLRTILLCSPTFPIFTGVPADVNSDGVDDWFRYTSNTWVVDGGQPIPGSYMLHSRFTETGDGTRESMVSVLRNSDLGGRLLAAFPGALRIQVLTPMWRDMDDDGDLDLVFQASSGGTSSAKVFWLENIGYEKPDPPVAADLNQDGSVNGDDLGLLLAAWTIP